MRRTENGGDLCRTLFSGCLIVLHQNKFRQTNLDNTNSGCVDVCALYNFLLYFKPAYSVQQEFKNIYSMSNCKS